ncbi:hypothetical protein [Streptomyces sp. NBC_01262]|uniref:hypothetical protein n=1 Tax=Streptomyces sp. NBC_01262 TaxID=2903803 RepID=UPI002E30D370|nr:hypothetical protein [Streptomyces sp. NBC_01262]
MALLIQDGRRSGHLKWTTEAVQRRCADGAIISAFCTPRIPRPRQRDAGAVVEALGNAEVLFDPMTHARLMSGSNKLEDYDTWGLWGNSGIGLDNTTRRLEHVERVFNRQSELGVPSLAPTLTVSSGRSTEADHAIETARVARGLDRQCYQSLAGTVDFFASGTDLDAYVGRLAGLRASTWVVTLVPAASTNLVADLAASTAGLVGWLRTIHSLSFRSRVIAQNADFLGLLAAAAGADTVGSGWDRSMKIFDSSSYQLSTPAPRRPASYVTQRGLAAVLRRTIADDIQRLDPNRAQELRGGPMPADDGQQRVHHLRVVRELVSDVYRIHDQQDSVLTLRGLYETALGNYDWLNSQVPGLVSASERDSWVNHPLRALESYAKAEGIW